ncbi:ABC transporter ATP-binding protein [Kitasatospora kazusensis]|uniref:ABC transporter ATP-binding protein n=1 Tax=Kitasatospora kazusensis TaxID=407974 RepID=A0ABN2ZNF4_9ACTN
MARHRESTRAPGWALLASQLTSTRSSLIRVLGWSGVEALPALLSGLLVSAAVDQGFLAGRPGVGCLWLTALGAAYAVRAYAARAAFPHVAAVVEPLRDALVVRVVRGALARPEPDPAAVARLTEQVESARQLTATLLRTLRGVGVTLLAALLGLALLAPVALLLVLPPLLVGGHLFVRLLGPLVARQRAVVLADEQVAAQTGRAFAGLRDITACGAQQRVGDAVEAAVRAQGTAVRALGRAAALRSLSVALGGRLPALAVALAAPWLVHGHWLTTGQVLGVATYLLQQLEPAVRTLAGTVGGWVLELTVVLDRLAALPVPASAPTAGAPTDPADPTDAGATVRPGAAGPAVRVTGLRHAHGPAAQPVLDGFELELAAGEHLAVVGPSGAGKSTLAALLAGVLAPQLGEVSIGGVRPHELPGPLRARQLALVPQEAYVFAGTVRSNLSWLDPEAGEQRLAEAVALLGAAELVARLGGPDGVIADPAALSAGEAQLIALVRTYLSPAPVVVLDEATCHLDGAAEARVEEAFAARPGTLVVIAHRIGSALRADRVLLLDSGRGLIARHGDLQVLSPLYRELVGHWLGSVPEARPEARPTAGPGPEPQAPVRASVRPRS